MIITDTSVFLFSYSHNFQVYFDKINSPIIILKQFKFNGTYNDLEKVCK